MSCFVKPCSRRQLDTRTRTSSARLGVCRPSQRCAVASLPTRRRHPRRTVRAGATGQCRPVRASLRGAAQCSHAEMFTKFIFMNALGLFKYYLVLRVDRRSELKKNTATLEMSPTSRHMQSDFSLLQQQDTLTRRSTFTHVDFSKTAALVYSRKSKANTLKAGID